MIENIMKGAKFGDRFMTRDNTEVLFIMTQNCYDGLLYEVVSPDGNSWFVDQNGHIDRECFTEQEQDIISRAEEK